MVPRKDLLTINGRRARKSKREGKLRFLSLFKRAPLKSLLRRKKRGEFKLKKLRARNICTF